MRSRDGDHFITLRFCTIILLSSLALHAGEFLISYRYVIKDATLFNETLLISRSMHKCSGEQQKALILESNGEKNLQAIISKNREHFIQYLHKLGLNLTHQEQTRNYQNSSTTILTLKTTCFKVDFNDNFAKIVPLK